MGIRLAGRSSIDIGSKDWVMTEHGRQIDILTHTQEKKNPSVFPWEAGSEVKRKNDIRA